MSGVQQMSHKVMDYVPLQPTPANRAFCSRSNPPTYRTSIYIDGSLRPEGAGAAAYFMFPGAPLLLAQMHLGPRSEYTSGDAEYWAAIIALRLVYKVLSIGFPGREFHIASDYLGVVHALNLEHKCHHPTAQTLQKHARRVLKEYPKVTIRSIHTPGHTGIIGNEMADSAAGAAAHGETRVALMELERFADLKDL